jgi:hypothetical protein
MSLKAPNTNRKPTTRPNQNLNKAAAKIYRKSEVFRRKNDMLDESGTPSPSPALIAERCAEFHATFEMLRWENSEYLKKLKKEADEGEAED